MIRSTALLPKSPIAALLAALILCGLIPIAPATPLAKIDIVPGSSGLYAKSGAPFNQNTNGTNNSPLGARVYMQALASTTTLLTYQWRMLSSPAGSTATLSATAGNLVYFRPDKVGAYQVALIPQLSGKSTTATVQLIHAATYVGVGTINTHADPAPRAPNCGTGYCHGGNNADPELNVLSEWQQAAHSTKLIRDLNGQSPTAKATCLPCHSVGYDTTTTAVNGGLDDVATAIGFNLTTQIPIIAAASGAEGLPHFNDLPAQLQNLTNIQCENCHGPGSQHPSHLTDPDHAIGGVDLTAKSCAQCHDAPGHHVKFWQWNNSKHTGINTLSSTISSQTPCSKCHTGDGFVASQVNGGPIVGYAPSASVPATCVVCHDPHYSDNPHQLRLSGDFTFDSGQSYKQVTGVDPGTGGLCMRCHSSRVVAVATSMASYRGAHHGPQGDMMAGINGYGFGAPFTANSDHSTSVTDTCVACHMAAPPASATPMDNTPKVGDHTWMMTDDKGTTVTSDDYSNAPNACGTCHKGITNYDFVDAKKAQDWDGNGKVEGIQTEVKGLMTILRTAILAKYPTKASIDSTGRISFSSTNYNALSTNEKGAVYNYNFVSDDHSFGVHNASYTIQLLQRSYTNFVGHPIGTDYPNMVLRSSGKGSSDAQDWPSYK